MKFMWVYYEEYENILHLLKCKTRFFFFKFNAYICEVVLNWRKFNAYICEVVLNWRMKHRIGLCQIRSL